MTDTQFQQFLKDLQKYLKQPKVFVTDMDRAKEFYSAVHIAQELFSKRDVHIKEDPLQTGAMILHIETCDITIRGAREINLFSDMIALADNFEIYSIGEERICFAAVFQKVHKKI